MTISVSAVFDRAAALIGDRRRDVAILALLPFAASLAQQIGAAALLDAPPPVQVAWGIVSVVLSLVSLWGQLGIAAFVVHAADPDPGAAGPARAIGAAARRLPLAILLYVLLLLALALMSAPIAVMLMAHGWTMTPGAPPVLGPGAAAFVVAWGGLAALVALIASARLAPLLAVVVAERRGIRSFGRTLRLTRGLTAKLAALLLLAALVAIVATVAVETVVGSLSRLLLGGVGPVTAAGVITALAVAGVVAGLTTLAATVAAMLYRLLVAPDGATAAA